MSLQRGVPELTQNAPGNKDSVVVEWFKEFYSRCFCNEHPEIMTYVHYSEVCFSDSPVPGALHFATPRARARFAKGIVALSADPLAKLYGMRDWRADRVLGARVVAAACLCPVCRSPTCPCGRLL